MALALPASSKCCDSLTLNPIWEQYYIGEYCSALIHIFYMYWNHLVCELGIRVFTFRL